MVPCPGKRHTELHRGQLGRSFFSAPIFVFCPPISESPFLCRLWCNLETAENRYIGECQVTYYCCEPYAHICGAGDGLTATGLPAQPGIVAVDPSVIPLGSTVIIDGQKYLAADTGEAVQGKHVDIVVPTHAEALELGVGSAQVWVVGP